MTHNGKPWTGPDQYEDSTGTCFKRQIKAKILLIPNHAATHFPFLMTWTTGKLMMLPVDITLVAEPAFRKWVEVYAKDEDQFFKVYKNAMRSKIAVVLHVMVHWLTVFCLSTIFAGLCCCIFKVVDLGRPSRSHCQALVSILVEFLGSSLRDEWWPSWGRFTCGFLHYFLWITLETN